MTKAILGTAFIDKEIDRIETKSREIIPKEVLAAAIVASLMMRTQYSLQTETRRDQLAQRSRKGRFCQLQKNQC